MRLENPLDAIVVAGLAAGGSHAAANAPRVKVPEGPAAILSTQDMGSSSLQLAVERDSTTKEIVVKMVDATTGEIVRQIPAEEVLRTARAITEMMAAQQGPAGSRR
jgi:flagellar protein FlaG